MTRTTVIQMEIEPWSEVILSSLFTGILLVFVGLVKLVEIMRKEIEYRVLEEVPMENSILGEAYWTHVTNEDFDCDFDHTEARDIFSELNRQGRKARLVKITTEVLDEC